jgi:hypothetical protein
VVCALKTGSSREAGHEPPDDEGWGGGEILARYESGVMLFLLILTVTIVALSVWLGAYLIGANKGPRREADAPWNTPSYRVAP